MATENTAQKQSSTGSRLIRVATLPNGTSSFINDDQLTPFKPFGPNGSCFTVFDTRQAVPVNNSDPIPSFADTLPRCPPKGAVFGVSDIPAGAVAPMHRTTSIDYCAIMSGEIIIKLDTGDEKTVRAGEFIVQQGANHQWINKSNETCRFMYVMLGADKIKTVDGTVLEETVFQQSK